MIRKDEKQAAKSEGKIVDGTPAHYRNAGCFDCNAFILYLFADIPVESAGLSSKPNSQRFGSNTTFTN